MDDEEDDVGDSSDTARWNDGPRVPRRTEAGDCDGESSRAREVTLNARARRRAGRDGTARGAAETVAAARTLMVRAFAPREVPPERGNRQIISVSQHCSFLSLEIFSGTFSVTRRHEISVRTTECEPVTSESKISVSC